MKVINTLIEAIYYVNYLYRIIDNLRLYNYNYTFNSIDLPLY
jgi:hypothetical protein